ncbi:MAG: hypothetical protein ACHQUA_02640 [Microgenomates group bacterium]
MSPEPMGNNMFQLTGDEVLVDYSDHKMVIKAPEIVREEPLGPIEGEDKGNYMRYQGASFVVGVQADDINEAIEKSKALLDQDK